MNDSDLETLSDSLSEYPLDGNPDIFDREFLIAKTLPTLGRLSKDKCKELKALIKKKFQAKTKGIMLEVWKANDSLPQDMKIPHFEGPIERDIIMTCQTARMEGRLKDFAHKVEEVDKEILDLKKGWKVEITVTMNNALTLSVNGEKARVTTPPTNKYALALIAEERTKCVRACGLIQLEEDDRFAATVKSQKANHPLFKDNRVLSEVVENVRRRDPPPPTSSKKGKVTTARKSVSQAKNSKKVSKAASNCKKAKPTKGPKGKPTRKNAKPSVVGKN